MGQGEPQLADDTRGRLIQTARTMVLRGDNNFTIAALCNEAQVDRGQFRAHFSGKTALMAALMQEQVSNAAPAFTVREMPQPAPQPELQTPKAEQEPSVPTPDAWLERRLRVLERALTALENKAETAAREQARAIAQIQERLWAANAERTGRQPVPETRQQPITEPVRQPAVAEPLKVVEPDVQAAVGEAAEQLPPLRPEVRPAAMLPLPVRAAHWSDAAPIGQTETLDDVRAPADEPMEPQEAPGLQEAPGQDETARPSAELISIAPMPVVPVSKQEMADVLESARARVRAAAAMSHQEEQPTDGNMRVRWIAIGALSLVALFLCIGLVLGHTAGAIRKDRVADWHGDGVSHRQAAQGALAQTIASADFGDAKAEARLALAYLRGQGVARDASAALRWSHAAAEAGEPAAQYLLGALYQQGEAVKADPAMALAWFQTAAAKGNLKAMHNLAIAYAEGLGTPKDEAKAVAWFTRAAERGYVDSAFDLAVMYERGAGVPQDLTQALKWYGIAAQAGDQPSKARAEFLRGQMNGADAKRAMDAAMAFAPLPSLPEANTL